MTLARSFNETAISRLRPAARSDAAIATSRTVGPYDHLAAVPTIKRVSNDARTGTNISLLRVLDVRVLALVVTTDKRNSTACSPGNIHHRLTYQANARRKQQNSPTVAVPALPID